jgi:hypothetical protein
MACITFQSRSGPALVTSVRRPTPKDLAWVEPPRPGLPYGRTRTTVYGLASYGMLGTTH